MALNPAQDQWDEAWSEFRAKLYRSAFFGPPKSGPRWEPPSVLAEPLHNREHAELVRRITALEVALGLHLDEAAKFKAEREAQKAADLEVRRWSTP